MLKYTSIHAVGHDHYLSTNGMHIIKCMLVQDVSVVFAVLTRKILLIDKEECEVLSCGFEHVQTSSV